MSRSRHIVLWCAAAFAAALATTPLGGCLEPHEQPEPRHQSNCTTCHGSPTRPGSELLRSAPPFNVAGSTDPRAPGNGAHAIHLVESDIHAGIACETCHVVPENTLDPGHVDSKLPAEVIFTGVAVANEREPVYDAERQRCADTYCHLDKTKSWIPDGKSRDRCNSCHGSPPPAPHPQDDACFLCHGDVVDETGAIVDKARHMDGVVDAEERCDTCHGAGDLGVPPPDLGGATERSSPGVGAHDVHLSGGAGSRALSCGECHTVPESAGDEGHLGADGRAEVMLTGVAETMGLSPSYDFIEGTCADSWCHGPSSPQWTDTEPLACDGCHGFPPALPHPQMFSCALCHAPVVDGFGIAEPERHVDGIVDYFVPQNCNACHGDATSSAPPVDLDGNTDTSFRGVGAHRVHVEGTSTSRAVPCVECHRVPSDVLDAGHVDTMGFAELFFSGVARAFGGSPRFDGNTCSDTYCHGDRFVLGHDSGGLITEPVWTVTDGSQSKCTSCHGLPPPPPHPPGPSFCSDCHPNIGFPLMILDPNLHVNGKVEVDL